MSDLRNRIYIGKLHYDVREKDIERFFKDFGKINDINMKNGYAFVDFDDHRDADDAVYEMDGKDLLGDRVSVEHCKGGRDRRDERRGGGGYSGGDRYGGGYGGDRGGSSRFKHSFSLFERPFNTKHRVVVEGLSSSTDWRPVKKDLKDFFRRVAEVTFADAHRFRTGEGVADFRSREDLRRVIRELDDTKLNGRRVRLTEEKQSRSRSKSRSPRRSARRSRSRSRSADRSRGSRTKDDRRSASTDKRDYRSKSRDRRSRSPEDKRSRSRSKDRRSHTPEKRSKSMERRSRSPEKRSRSKSPKEDEGKSGDLKEADTFERSKSESPEKEAEMEAADTVAKDGE